MAPDTETELRNRIQTLELQNQQLAAEANAAKLVIRAVFTKFARIFMAAALPHATIPNRQFHQAVRTSTDQLLDVLKQVTSVRA